MKNVVLSLLLFVGLLLIALTTSSCGSSSPTEEGSGAVRFINAIPDYISLEIEIPSAQEHYGLIYGEDTGYGTYEEGSLEVKLYQPASPAPLLSEDVRVKGGEYNTVIFTGNSAKLSTLELTDNQDRPKLGYFKLRFVNLINSKDKYDLYFVYPGFSFFGYDPIVENFGFGKTTAYYDAETATAEVFVTEAGTDNVVYDSGLLDFEDRSVSTFLLLENPGGGEPFEGLFLEDR